MRSKMLMGAAAAAFTMMASSATAATFTHYDEGGDNVTRGSGGFASAITSDTTVELLGLGILADLNQDGDITFSIYDDTPGVFNLLFSTTSSFVDDGFTYKFSDAFSFVLEAGTTYYIGATATGGTSENQNVFGADQTGNTVGGFTFGADNIIIRPNGTFQGNTGNNDIATALVTADQVSGAVPEPSTWLMLLAGFGLVGGMMRRKREQFSLGFA